VTPCTELNEVELVAWIYIAITLVKEKYSIYIYIRLYEDPPTRKQVSLQDQPINKSATNSPQLKQNGETQNFLVFSGLGLEV